jgi:polyhydroxybutyrate depolymerase
MPPVRSRAIVSLLAVLALGAGCSGGASEGSDVDGAAGSGTSTTTTVVEGPGTSTVDPSPGCGTEPDVEAVDLEVRPGDVEQVIDAGGNERLYRLGVPPSYDPDVAAPLVLNLHGSGSDALQASTYGDVARAGAERGMITVAAQAIGGQWQLGADGDDAEFLDLLVDDIEARYCVDRARVYLVGMSLGAWKAAVTACAADGRYAAVSLVTVEVFPGSCDPLPVIAFHGRADRTVPYGDNGEVDASETRLSTLPGAEQNIGRWAASGGCAPEPEVEPIGDDVEVRTFVDCHEGVSVVLHSIDGGGHTWPGSDIVIGPATATTDTIDATELTLDFFEAHRRLDP